MDAVPTQPADAIDRREEIRRRGLELGFTQVGFAPAETPIHAETYREWLARGRHGEMGWMAREDAVRRRLDPREALEGCRTLIVVSLSYAPRPSRKARESSDDRARAADGSDTAAGGRPAPIVARYAAPGRDYHDWFEERLGALADVVRSVDPEAGVKPYVDYGPVLERDHAQRAGLGWIGKNTLLIHPRLGSWLLLGELLTTLELPPDDPFLPDHCGSCRRCIEACPTAAILEERQVDARRCISYLTIELRGPIPSELREAIGTRVFGCDICQEACPWNRDPEAGKPDELALGRPAAPASLREWADELLALDEVGFRERYRGTPLARPKREGLLRNVCVGLGNAGEADAVPVLLRCIEDPSPLVREHAAWALGRLGAGAADDGSSIPGVRRSRGR